MLMLKEYVDEDGEKLGEAFTKLPTKTELPEYYKMIKDPVDMVKIEGRIIGNVYRDNSAFQTAVELMFANAREYNDADSTLFNDATKLRDFARRELYRVTQRGIPLERKELKASSSKSSLKSPDGYSTINVTGSGGGGGSSSRSRTGGAVAKMGGSSSSSSRGGGDGGSGGGKSSASSRR